MSIEKGQNTPKRSRGRPPKDREHQVYYAALDLKNVPDINRRYDAKFTTSGDLSGYDVNTILQDTQNYTNILKLYSLSNFYCNSDNLLSGAIHNVLIPFSVTKWRLQGGTATTRKFYQKYFEDFVNLNDFLYDVFHDIYVYGVAYIYADYTTGSLQILPPHRITVADVNFDGTPILSYVIPQMQSMSSTYNVTAKDLPAQYQKNGYPPEVVKAVSAGQQRAILDPHNTFAINLPKAAWEKYSLPLCTPLLPLFSKKNLISQTEDTQLANMSRTVLHIKVGDKENIKRPNQNELRMAANAFRDAINNSDANIAATAWNVDAEWKYVSLKDDANTISQKYADVNSQILAGIGLSALIVAGDSINKDSSASFSSSTVNANIASKRINYLISRVKSFIEKLMDNLAVNQRTNLNNVPDIVFERVDLNSSSMAVDEILKLYQQGVFGTQTVLERLGYNYEQEKERRQEEQKIDDNGINDEQVFAPRKSANTMSSSDSSPGAPTKPIDESLQDKNHNNEQPKPSKQ